MYAIKQNAFQKPITRHRRANASCENINSRYNKKSNYLTETTCEKIQQALRKDYFRRLKSVSVNKLQNDFFDNNEERKLRNINFEEMYEKPTTYAAKQIMFSNKIRKDNYNWIKKHPKKSRNNELDFLSNQIFNDTEEYRKQFMESSAKKSPLPVIKKVTRDKNPLYYDLGYIDEVENKFIKPFLSNDNIIYTDFIENKKSKAPFNFIIG